MTSHILTAKQNRFYEVLRRYIVGKGAAPTVAELQKLCALSSPRAVTQYLEVLERKGLITRSRYEHRGIKLHTREPYGPDIVRVPVMASAGCDNAAIFAERTFDEYICVASDLLEGKRRENVVSIRAVGASMEDAGIREGDYVLVEMTEAVQENDLVVAIIDGFAVIKKLERANNAFILKPVSSDPQYQPIILNKNFRFFGRVIDIIRSPQKGDIEVVPLVSAY
jgi:SOS regulatory protein LexA